MSHYQKLAQIFTTAPCNQYYQATFAVSEGRAEVQLPLRPDFWQMGGVVHGSVLFKLLDDAATVACISLLEEEATVTSTFTIYFLRPISTGIVTAVGQVVRRGKTQLLAEAVAVDETGRELARGSGLFVPVPLVKANG